MDEGVQRLQQRLVEVELEAEHLLLARQQLVESDKVRNSNREALTALRKQARTSKSSVPVLHEFPKAAKVEETKPECLTCGSYGGTEAVWFMCPRADLFLSLPFHEAHSKLENDQEHMEVTVKKLQSFVKEKTMSLSDKGALSDTIGPDLLRALVTLKDDSGQSLTKGN
eukprot:c21079_g2_i2 orf=257-763(+)